MTEVLAHSQSDSPFTTSSLSPSASQTSLYLHGREFKTPQTTVFEGPRKGSEKKGAASIASSDPSSPQLGQHDSSSQPSLLSTPSSSLSLEDDNGIEDIVFPRYAAAKIEPATQAKKGSIINLTEVPVTSNRSVSATDMPEVPLRPNPSFVSMGDDLFIRKEPARHVDYLSHTWTEEDVCSSWRHVVSRRKDLENSARLENASWRSWTKSQKRLSTLSPEKLNWMKDHDVTWLYGPLQTLDPTAVNPDSPVARSRLSRTNSFISKKPILKRRSVSAAMLQRSLSNSTLVRQAVDCIASQEYASPVTRPMLPVRPSSRFSEHLSLVPSPHPSLDDSSSTTSGADTPAIEKKHIHFNEQVEQCIAVDKDLEDVDYMGAINSSDDSSDDGLLMMQTHRGKERKLSSSGKALISSTSSDPNCKLTIAMLPATTLKYRSDTPEPPERQSTPRISDPRWLGARNLKHSSSSETLKPAQPSANFLIDEDDDAILDWQPSSSQRNGSSHSYYSEGGIPMCLDNAEDEELEARGMRRTPSGMFMPYDGDEDDIENEGLFGRVLDTVNTARDIAHVIWNVGWRR